MKVVHLLLPEKVEVRDIPARRNPEPRELLLEPLFIGLSGSDALRFRKGPPTQDGFRHPHVPGTEFVARVAGYGRGVDSCLLGKRVVANPVSPCGDCLWCKEGSQNLCPRVRILGYPPTPGALQQRFCWPASLCEVVPDEIPSDLAVLLVPLSNAVHILDHAQVRLMSSVAVVGCGHLGLLMIQTLRAAGVQRIVAVDLAPYRREAALEHGATDALDATEALAMTSQWPRRGVDVAIDVSNASEGCRTAVMLTQVGGRVLIAGVPADNRIIFNADDARRKELSVQFVRRPHNTLARAVALLQSGRLKNVEKIITHMFDLHEIPDAFRTIRFLKDGIIKALIRMPAYEPKEESPGAIAEAREEEEKAAATPLSLKA